MTICADLDHQKGVWPSVRGYHNHAHEMDKLAKSLKCNVAQQLLFGYERSAFTVASGGFGLLGAKTSGDIAELIQLSVDSPLVLSGELHNHQVTHPHHGSALILMLSCKGKTSKRFMRPFCRRPVPAYP